jgi:hypothetical protein
MPRKDTGPVVLVLVVPTGVVPTGVAPGVLPIPGVFVGVVAAFEHALNRQVTIMARSVPNQMKSGRFLPIVSMCENSFVSSCVIEKDG